MSKYNISSKRNHVDGWLVIDKPKEITSFSVVSLVKKFTNAKKVGHAGTLDPLATGILPIALGEATKTINFVTDAVKEYEFTITFGEARDTDDQEGKIIATSDKRPSTREITKALKFFCGDIIQSPPIYSAIKINGHRAYKLARQGLISELPKRKVTIHKIELLKENELSYCLEAKIRVLCSKGTYIRSIARDLSIHLGTCGYISYLRRIRVGKFILPQSISLEKLEKLYLSNDLLACIMPIEIALDDIPAFYCSSEQAKFLRQGRALKIELLQSSSLLSYADNEVIAVFLENKVISLVKKFDGYLKPIKMFNYYIEGGNDVDYSFKEARIN